MESRLAARAAVLSLVLGVQFAAAAKTQKFETSFDRVDVAPLTLETARYTGRLESPRDICIENRNVLIIHDSKPPFTIGDVQTNRSGRFSHVGPLPPAGDRIIFRAVSRDVSTAKRDRICLGDELVVKSPDEGDDD